MKEKESSSLRETTGKWAVRGGIVAGVIGLLSLSELIVASRALIGAGYILKTSGKSHGQGEGQGES